MHEALGVSPMSFEKDLAPGGVELVGATVVNGGRRHEPQSRVPVRVVVVVEETAAEQAAVFQTAKAAWEFRAILHRLELGLGVGIIVRDVRPRVRLGYAEVGQEQGDGLASHRAAAVCVDGELVGFDVLLEAALADETTGELGAFSPSQHPPGHVPGEDVENHVEVKVGPLDRAAQLRYVPRPNLVRRFRHELRLLIVRMPQLVPALTHLSVLRQNPVHRADRTVVDSLVQKRGPHLGRRLVDEPFAMQCTEDPLALGRVEGSLRPRTALRLGRHRSASTIQRGTRHAQRLASFRRLSNPTRQLLGRHDQSFSSSSIGFRGIPRSSEAFLRNSGVRTRCSRLYQRVA